jgi:hypothetical protein
MAKKNWRLFNWALKHLKVDSKSNDVVYKKCLRNNILLRLMDLSGVTPVDAQIYMRQIDNELKTRVS